mmetsp:Transcript_22001/g.23981  ORF Transcript_22001/g.23981 Transcript_22001/m.23981 type:complete len:213 (-) Transcript_22001:46-684(-)|eukprot:CAMPEP_0173143662 /NCGR_PEP_ID=MMETSP1105-20130129/6789_1 /TAXON_ID=2985 /ORGANISM="Ochromonas sp., Strain BG-1" /LENGTH=212 /DNA_ID=CAMNT_0014057231 /DNA_START=50 /DNA_END=688 /DNA_ORIENTATION=-
MINNLYELNTSGMLTGISKDVYEASKHLVKKLDDIENATLDSFTHFVHNVKEDDLMKLMRTTHLKPAMFKQFEEKFLVINNQDQDSGDYLLLLHEDKGDFTYSKAIVILHVSVTNKVEEKRFSCLLHTLNYEARFSLVKVVVGVSATASLFFVNPLLGAVGVAVTAFFSKVDIPSDVRKALDVYLIQRLINSGHIVDEGTKFMLKVPQLEFK